MEKKTAKYINIGDNWQIPLVSQEIFDEQTNTIIEAINSHSGGGGSGQLGTNIFAYSDSISSIQQNAPYTLNLSAQMIAGELHLKILKSDGSIFADIYAPQGTATVVLNIAFGGGNNTVLSNFNILSEDYIINPNLTTKYSVINGNNFGETTIALAISGKFVDTEEEVTITNITVSTGSTITVTSPFMIITYPFTK